MEWIVSLVPEAAADPMAALEAPPSGATIVELRIDRFPGIDMRAAVAACPLPVLVTLRSRSEGGEGPDDAVERAVMLATARDAGAAMLDLEVARDSELVSVLGLDPERVVLSWHDPNGTPPDLPVIVERLLSSPARWVKVVPTAARLDDLRSLLDLHKRFNGGRRRHRRLLAFAMGTPGLASRYLAPLLGPSVGYAAWSEDAPAAPGQLTIGQTEAVISHLNGKPQRLYGVVGADVRGSLSPVLHGAGYRALDLPFLLLPISVPDPAELGEIFAPMGQTCFDRVGLAARGWAVTTPYKAEAAAAADRRAPRVERAGAANTLILGSGGIMAENTDADGVVGSLVSLGIDPLGRPAVIQGTGGAARGAAVGLHLAGADVVVRGRTARRTSSVAAAIRVGWCGPTDPAPKAAILVNATPLGREPDDPVPFSDDEIAAAAAVVDMVYAGHTTQLVARALEHGVPVADGREVLLHQAIAQFAAFTQQLPPKEAMREALEAFKRWNVITLNV